MDSINNSEICFILGLKEVIVPQLGCHSESPVSACESTASKPKKRKKEEVSGEKLFRLLVVWPLDIVLLCFICFTESQQIQEVMLLSKKSFTLIDNSLSS